MHAESIYLLNCLVYCLVKQKIPSPDDAFENQSVDFSSEKGNKVTSKYFGNIKIFLVSTLICILLNIFVPYVCILMIITRLKPLHLANLDITVR